MSYDGDRLYKLNFSFEQILALTASTPLPHNTLHFLYLTPIETLQQTSWSKTLAKRNST